MLRSFIALEIPSDAQSSIAKSISKLQESVPKTLVRWVATSNLHLTLKFLGDVSAKNIEQLADVLRTEAARVPFFDMTFGGIGAFPSSRRARMIWIGVHAPADLLTIQHIVESTTVRMGYPPEDRPFSPHLTIGRVNQNASTRDLTILRSALEAIQVGVLATLPVHSMHIFKSELTPGGSIYTDLFTLPFKNTIQPRGEN